LRLFCKALSITIKKVCVFSKIIPKKFGKLKRLPYLRIIKEHQNILTMKALVKIGKKYHVENLKTGKSFKATVKDIEGNTIKFNNGVTIDYTPEQYNITYTF
jgi:hypothetical protein